MIAFIWFFKKRIKTKKKKWSCKCLRAFTPSLEDGRWWGWSHCSAIFQFISIQFNLICLLTSAYISLCSRGEVISSRAFAQLETTVLSWKKGETSSLHLTWGVASSGGVEISCVREVREERSGLICASTVILACCNRGTVACLLPGLHSDHLLCSWTGYKRLKLVSSVEGKDN